MCAKKVVACARSSAVLSNTRPVDTRQFRSVHDFHQIEVLAVAIPWGFESPLPHQQLTGNAWARQTPLVEPFLSRDMVALHGAQSCDVDFE